MNSQCFILCLVLVQCWALVLAKPERNKKSVDYDVGFSQTQSDDRDGGYDRYESYSDKGGDQYGYADAEDLDGKKLEPQYGGKPIHLQVQEFNDGGDAGYVKKDKKKGGDGYKNFKSFANKNKDDFAFEKHEGFSKSDSQTRLGDKVSEPVRESHFYEVTERTKDFQPRNVEYNNVHIRDSGESSSRLVNRSPNYGFQVYHDFDSNKSKENQEEDSQTDASSSSSESNEDNDDDGYGKKNLVGNYQEYSEEDDGTDEDSGDKSNYNNYETYEDSSSGSNESHE